MAAKKLLLAFHLILKRLTYSKILLILPCSELKMENNYVLKLHI